MASIYIHIPICQSRCAYCAFYSTTQTNKTQALTDGLLHELDIRKKYLLEAKINTLYFGGGTPTMLNSQQLESIISKIRSQYAVSETAEITLEANPGDLTAERLTELKAMGINRLSIGIQSFDDNLLHAIGRRHTAATAIHAVEMAQQTGFQNISIDLIYGLPNQSDQQWQADLQQAIALNVPHISAYGLSYEEGTPLWHSLQAGKVDAASDEKMNAMYDVLTETLEKAGIKQYEVSNFAKEGFHSRHNSAYWDGTPYLGIGPAAHSFDGQSRQWNVASLDKYLQAMDEQRPFFEREILSSSNCYDEQIMLELRTVRGIDLTQLENRFGNELLHYCMQQAQRYIETGKLQLRDEHLAATHDGFKILNLITEDLMQA